MKLSKHSQVAIPAIIIILAASVYISYSLGKTPRVNFISVKKTDITQGVSVDGTVQAAQALALAFQQGGVISEIDVKAGDLVKKGQYLVRLDTKDASAAVSQASAALAVAQANYDKVQNGATSQQIDVSKAAVLSAQTALDNAKTSLAAIKSQQDTAVQNALTTLLNTSVTAIAGSSNLDAIIPTVTGTYTGTDQGVYNISIYSGSSLRFQASGLESAFGDVRTSPVALGAKGLFIQFSAYPSTNDTWTVSIPNTYSSAYVANSNAYQTALRTRDTQMSSAQAQVNTAQSALAQAQANLELQQSAARPEDIASARALVETAGAMLQTAQNSYAKSIITAPIDGIVTSVDTKVGQTVAGSTLAPGVPVVKMISNQKFQIETYISEADVAKIKVGDPARVILDAYGSGVNFDAGVIAIDPAATISAGISTYKTTLEFNQDDVRIKAGMGASAVITDSVHQGVLAIPASAVIKKANQAFVLTDAGNGKVRQTQIQTGITGLDGMVEVVSGLSEGQKIVLVGNQ